MPQPYVLSPAVGSDAADEWHRLGVEAQVAGNLGLAQHRYCQALRLDPRHALAAQNLAIVYACSPGMLNEALLTIERAEMMDGVHSVIKVNRALMSLEAGRVNDALEIAESAVRLAPKDCSALMALAMVCPQAGKAQQAVELYNAVIDIDPKQTSAAVNACFTQTLTDATPAELLKQRQVWYRLNRWNGKPVRHQNSKDSNRPLRIGYVSGDFKQHSASFIFARVLLHHTPAVEAYFYSCLPTEPDKDVRAKKFREAAGDRWRDIEKMSDEEAAELIRKDRIDILVDLAAHTSGCRLPLFTHKPAPVQATAWGFAHGTGCPEIDYFLADPVAVPEAERQHYAEKIFDLPCMLTLEPPEDYQLKGVSLPPIRKNGVFTFGCYARYEKMSDDCLRTYAEIMKRVDDARIEFKDMAYSRPYSIRRLLSFFEGVDPARLLFSIGTTHPDHMLTYQQADLCLDPFPHCGGVVSLEQLWMGVPVLTLRGKAPHGRNTSCVLTAMKRAEWIADSKEEYIEKAVTLAEAPKTLADARKTLRDELMASPVYAGYVEAVESAFRTMFERWCER